MSYCIDIIPLNPAEDPKKVFAYLCSEELEDVPLTPEEVELREKTVAALLAEHPELERVGSAGDYLANLWPRAKGEPPVDVAIGREGAIGVPYHNFGPRLGDVVDRMVGYARTILEVTGWSIYDQYDNRVISLKELPEAIVKHVGYGVGVIEDLTRATQLRSSEGDAAS